MGRLRLWLQVGCVVAVLVAAVLAADRAYESRSIAKATQPEAITVRKAAIIQAYAAMARAIPGVEVEADQSCRSDCEVQIFVCVGKTPDNAMESLATLANLLPITDCGGKIIYVESPTGARP